MGFSISRLDEQSSSKLSSAVETPIVKRSSDLRIAPHLVHSKLSVADTYLSPPKHLRLAVIPSDTGVPYENPGVPFNQRIIYDKMQSNVFYPV